jgi:hypothetical protein
MIAYMSSECCTLRMLNQSMVSFRRGLLIVATQKKARSLQENADTPDIHKIRVLIKVKNKVIPVTGRGGL